MTKRPFNILFFIVLFVFIACITHFSIADSDIQKNMRNHQRERLLICYMETAKDPIYEEECGTCHFAYQAELLPEASWLKILAGLENHFGETIILDDESKNVIMRYLKGKCAENSPAKYSINIMGSLGRHAPLRITDIPYIRKAHKDISPDIFDRDSVGSLSNCTTCHLDAESGIYNKDNVSIPK